MHVSARLAGGAAIILAALSPAPSRGQSFWIGSRIADGATVEVVKPGLKDVDLSAASVDYYFSLRFPISPMVRLVGELPFSYVGSDDQTLAEHGGNIIGNPYVGAEYTPESFFSFEGGFRVPVVEDAKWRFLGMYGDIDRIDAFQDVTPIYVRANFRLPVRDSRFLARLSAGPSIWLTGDDAPDVLAAYGGQLWYQGAVLEVGTGLSGIFLTTVSGSMADRTWHQLGFAGNVVSGSVRPGIHVRLPIGGHMGDVLDYAVGLHVTIPGVR